VLVPLDGSELAESVLDAAVAVGGSTATYILARASDAEPVHGLTVEITGLERDAAADLRARVHAYLNAVAAGLRARGLQVETKALHGRDLAEAILDTANASRADLIAIAIPSGDIMERLVVGIVAEQIARGTTVPVLLRRPVQAPKAATPSPPAD
jgi:universal stress protein E